MTFSLEENSEKIAVSEVVREKDLSVPEELPPSERARFALAGWVLLGAVLLMLIAWAIEVFYPALQLNIQCPQDDLVFCRAQSEKLFQHSVSVASAIFELAKTWIPPVVTLVLGYYFGRGGDSGRN